MEEDQNRPLKIGDLVEIPEIRTVIQLDDLADTNLRQMIVDTFVLTSEVLDNLKSVLTCLSGPEASGPESFSRWESLVIKGLSPLPYLKEGLYEMLKRINLSPPPFLKQEVNSFNQRFQEVTRAFTRFYRQALPLWERGEGPRPLMIQDIPWLLSKKRDIPEHSGVLYLLMDGMRWDLWEKIKSDFFGKMPERFRFVREGVFWVNQPSDTAPQMERFDQELRKVHGDRDVQDLLWKVSGIDEKVHTEKGPLSHLFGNVVSYLRLEILYRLKALPSRTLLILFADHGFVENPSFSPANKYESPRYLHGKDSPLEVIVPWAWVMRI